MLNASDSTATFVKFDIESNGTCERTDETDFTIEVAYGTQSIYIPVAHADNDPDRRLW